MVKRATAIVLFITAFLNASATAASDSLPAFRNTAAFAIFSVAEQKNVYLDCSKKALTLFVFLSPECPLCQNYTKTLNDLHNRFGAKIDLYGIVPGNAYESEELVNFVSKYKVVFKVGIDKEFLLTKYLQASVTPQVILLDSSGSLVYKGAIDDWVTGLGKKKQTSSVHYTADAIQQYLGALPVKIKSTRSYGCKINDI